MTDEQFYSVSFKLPDPPESSITLKVPPEQVGDLQKLFRIESLGFLPPGSLQYCSSDRHFQLELSGKAVTHLLELLEIATDERHAETWSERTARESDQLALFV